MIYAGLASCQRQLDNLVQLPTGPVLNEVSLNGTWKFSMNPPAAFWDNKFDFKEWDNIQVPGECAMQGFAIKHDLPFAYIKVVDIPAAYKEKRIILRFDGVYSYARVWVNGHFIRDHSGGFTRWDCDLTAFVNPGQKAVITVEVTDRADEISYGSGYAKHPIGGILRDVHLLPLPHNYPDELFIETDFDRQYKNAVLKIFGRTSKKTDNARINVVLRNHQLQTISMETQELELTDSTFRIENLIQTPIQWDAEHPYLYQLEVSFSKASQLLWQKTYQVGFREVQIKGNQLLVNGNPVKLRGACRHDIHPTLGRVSTPEYELEDVLLAKEANFNFIRTSHYPPTDGFLQLCDEYGLYVEDETAVCFVGSHRTQEYYPGSSESDPTFTQRYLSQLEEMVQHHRNHPSVIIWSVGNENEFGTNFKKSYDWVKKNDSTRPVMFSYPGKVPDSLRCYDIVSMHYPGIDGNMNQYGITTESFEFSAMPVLFDEWAHVACYNNFTIQEDPNIRDFWGQSLDSMWQKVFATKGGLGGAIWGMIDETFMLPDTLSGFNEWWGRIDPKIIPAAYSGHNVGYGEWGIIDTWRRKKPEFWNTKKAYSPVKLLETTFSGFTGHSILKIPVYNRFDHTNLKELQIKCIFDGQEKVLVSPDINPHEMGNIELPLAERPQGHVRLEFYDAKKQLIDQYDLRLKSPSSSRESSSLEKLSVEETATHLIIRHGAALTYWINRQTGLFTQIGRAGDTIKLSGPYFNLRLKGEEVMYSYHKIADQAEEWTLKNLSYQSLNDVVKVNLEGTYAQGKHIEYSIALNSQGEIQTTFQLEDIPDQHIREAGIKYILMTNFDSLSWQRRSYWSSYPKNHLSAPEGHVALYTDDQNIYRQKPHKDWIYDTKSFYYDGTQNEMVDRHLTHVARSTKENIYNYCLQQKTGIGVEVMGDGDLGCRIEKNNSVLTLFINNHWDYIDLSWGNYQKNLKLNSLRGVSSIKLSKQ